MRGTAHRVRAIALGTTAAGGLFVAAIAAGWTAVGETARLDRSASVQPLDALPLVLWCALTLALLWAALLTASAAASLRESRSGAGLARREGRAPAPPSSSGLVGRLPGVLLAVTAFGTAGTSVAVAAPARPAQVRMIAAPAIPAANVVATADDSCGSEAPPVPGWVPDAPARTDQTARDSAGLVTGCPVPDDSGEVVVRRGDSLWSLVAQQLGPQADATAIAAEWPRWYAANRDLIGDDPDLLRVGTRLHSPDTAMEGTPR
ncbi:LysM peptidoglycan-binding domain-containing protein [Flexivirga meconopsidis]|uniref:LysM peptidoglycan-binding domain-containing protein n=1 Tax=Flexivirga meconopsidis TaxID=2977121 RepID=UPI00223FBB8C|nr:hypothetical protein [Flexivirga meconopsidis]